MFRLWRVFLFHYVQFAITLHIRIANILHRERLHWESTCIHMLFRTLCSKIWHEYVSKPSIETIDTNWFLSQAMNVHFISNGVSVSECILGLCHFLTHSHGYTEPRFLYEFAHSVVLYDSHTWTTFAWGGLLLFGVSIRTASMICVWCLRDSSVAITFAMLTYPYLYVHRYTQRINISTTNERRLFKALD